MSSSPTPGNEVPLPRRRVLLYKTVGALKAARVRAGRLVPARVRPAIRRLLDYPDRFMIRRYRRRTGQALPIPPRSLRVVVGGASIPGFVAAGRHHAAVITSAMARAGRPIAEAEPMLDFGCGCGRTLIALVGSAPRLFACDVNEPAVRWVQGNLESVHAEVSEFTPPLPEYGQQFTAAYSVSVFTHLDWPAQRIWLTELARILAPGAPLIATAHGEAAIRSPWWNIAHPELAAMIRSRAGRLEDEGLVFFEEKPSFKQDTKMYGIKGSYGLTFQSARHVREHWSEHFDVVEVREGALDGFQDVAILRRS